MMDVLKEFYKDYDRDMLIHALVQANAEVIRLRNKTIDDLVDEKIRFAVEELKS